MSDQPKKRGRPRKSEQEAKAQAAQEMASEFHKNTGAEEYWGEDGASTMADLANAFSGLADPAGMFSYPGTTMGGYGVNWNRSTTIPQLPGTSKLSTPKPDDFKTQMIWAREIRDVKLVHGPLLRRRKFIVSGFRHRHSDSKIVELYDKIAEVVNLKSTLKSIAWELGTVGWVVVMPDQINDIPQAVHLLQDGIENERVFGIDNVFLRVDNLVAEKIKNNAKNFPDYMVKAVSNDEFNGKIPMEGCYFLAVQRAINSPFPRSPLFPLFEPIKVIENLVETQFAISFAIKQLIMHVKVAGNEGPDGMKRPATMTQLKNASKQVMDASRTTTIVTPDNVTIEFLSPDASIFEAANVPYTRAMERINKNIGIPMILVDGDAGGVSFSTAVYVIKGFLQDVINDREVLLDNFVYPWYKKIAAKLYNSDPKKYGFLFDKKKQDVKVPEVIFNETELKNMLEQLQILKFKWQTGMYSGQDITEAFQDDYDTVKKRKEAFNADCDFVYLPFEPNQGLARNVEDIHTQPNASLIAPDGEPMDQKDIMEMQHDQQLEQSDQDHNESLHQQHEQHRNNLHMADVQHDNNLQALQAKPAPGASGKAAKVSGAGGGRQAKKVGGTPGRPPSIGAPPRSDKTNRPPRSGSPSARGMNPQARPKGPSGSSMGADEGNLNMSDIIRELESQADLLGDLLAKENGHNPNEE